MYSYPVQRKRRVKLMQTMKDGLIYIKSKDELIRNGDVPAQYRQDSNFLYLTAIEEINYHLVLDPKTNLGHLFIPDVDPLFLVWMGKMYTTKEAKAKFGAKRVHYYSEFERVFKELNKKYKTIYTMPESKDFIKKQAPKHKIDTEILERTVHYMRAFKDEEGMRLMKQAAKTNHSAFVHAMSTIKAGIFEYQISALIDKVYRDLDSPHNAFPTIAAVGRSPAVLHYLALDKKAKPGDLVMIDAGCECHGYASDVTRTFPVGTSFSKRQREIYDIVLHTQKVCIKASQPGTPFQKIHELACRSITTGLRDTGILNKKLSVDDLYQQNAHRLFFPHGIGHLLGLDAHDVGAGYLPRSIPAHPHMRTSVDLLPNMVITIEPGIYFLEVYFKSAQARKKHAHLVNWSKADPYYAIGGIRIEDNLIITKSGNTNLTKIPKEVVDIEKMRQQAYGKKS